MKKGAIVNLKRLKVLDFITINRISIIMCVIFIIGVAVGSAVFPNSEHLKNFSKDFFEKYLHYFNGNSYLLKLTFSILRYLFILLLMYISGTSMFGVAVVPFFVCWHGITIGNLSAFLYNNYALKGIAFNAIILVPTALIFTICVFFAAKESINFSLLLAKLSLPKSSPANIYFDFKKFCGKYIFFSAICILIALIDTLLSGLFLRFFEF